MSNESQPRRCRGCGNEIDPDYPWSTCAGCDKATRGDQPVDGQAPANHVVLEDGVIVTGPDDPWQIAVQVADPDDVNDEPITVHLVAKFTDRPDVRLTVDKYRARHIGELLIKAADIIDERLADADTFERITGEAS